MSRWSHLCCLLSLVFLLTLSCAAQSAACQAPAIKAIPPGANLFSDKQEMELAGLFHRQLEQDEKIIEDEAVTGELQKVADRLASRFPNTGIKFRVYIVDSSDTNAFAEPGGNIYFTRKLVALFHNEDELAGVMAHEMGHIVTHQGAISISQLMRSVLGITQLTDHDDVEDKYNELLDSYRKKPSAFKTKNVEQQHQIDADQVAVFALGAAGYDVKSLPNWWDRFTENKGKKGNFLSDMFGGTTEERRRFRDMLKNAAAMPAECVGKHPEVSDADFKKWRTAVLSYEGIGHREKLDALVARKSLTPPLRAELTRLKISPDGKYVLAQDPGSIAVLTREDFKPLFRIDVDEARSVDFTPDSKQIAFYSFELFTSPRVEVWNIADQSMSAAYELRVPNGCNQAALSQDAKYFACIFPENELTVFNGLMFDLRVLTTEDGEVAYERKGFFQANLYSAITHLYTAIENGEELQVVAMRFSPDSKYLLLGREDMALALDAATGAKVSLPNSIKNIMKTDFAFVGTDRIVGTAGANGEKGAVLKFPSGEVVYSNLKMGLTHVNGVANGDYAIVYPLKNFACGLYDFKKNDFVLGSKKLALDVYGDEYLHERGDGEIAAVALGPGDKVRIKKPLAEGPLGRVVASAASDDLNFVAISGTVRGAVWNVDRGLRLAHLRRFNGVGVDNVGFTLADFPEEGEQKRMFAQINPMTGFATSFPADADATQHQHGAYLFDWVLAKKGDWKHNVTLRMKSIRTNTVLWTRTFANGAPGMFVEDDIDSLILAYDVNDSNGKAEVQSNSELRAKVQALKTKEHAFAMESLDLKTGKVNGVMALDTGKGSFSLRDAFRAGQYMVITDTQDRVQVYGFDGVRKGRMQSHGAMGTRDGSMLAASVGRGKLAIFDLASLKKINELDFSSRIALFRFSAAGDRLLVVTRDQKAYYFDTKKLAIPQQVASN